jgi:hypothetical protein
VALVPFRSRSRVLTASFVSARARSREEFPGSEARAASRAITATFADFKALVADERLEPGGCARAKLMSVVTVRPADAADSRADAKAASRSAAREESGVRRHALVAV